jgi:hypothetical protein
VATDDYERARYAVVAPAIQFPFYGTVEALKGDGESYRWFRPMGKAKSVPEGTLKNYSAQ